ncbi:MAG: secondary thiamine-phosphate synthase enzyme YjbQ [Candidatus Asgardarchaeia archaeon]
MIVFRKDLHFRTKGEIDIIDITYEVEKVVSESKVKDGTVTVFVPGSTGAITTIEYEPNLIQDFKEIIEQVFPRSFHYRHPVNGRSHVRASSIGPGVTIPISNGRLTLGTWQQIVFVEFDTRPRSRTVIVQVMGV